MVPQRRKKNKKNPTPARVFHLHFLAATEMNEVVAEPRDWGSKVQHRFLYYAMPMCNYLVEKAWDQFYRGSLGPDLRTLYSWWETYRQFGMLPCEAAGLKKRLGTDRGRSGSMPKEAVDTLASLIKDKPWLYLDEVQQYLAWAGHECSRTAVWRAMTTRLNLTRKKMETRARQRRLELRNEFRSAMRNIPVDKVIWVDEMHADANLGQRTHGWGPKGASVVVKRSWNPFAKDCNFSFIACVNVNGFVPNACELAIAKRGRTTATPTVAPSTPSGSLPT
jgi:hypothetical protein